MQKTPAKGSRIPELELNNYQFTSPMLPMKQQKQRRKVKAWTKLMHLINTSVQT